MMRKHKILNTAVQKAFKNGWRIGDYDTARVGDNLNIFFYNDCKSHGPEDFSKDYSVFDVIYDHDFAKALWGTDTYARACEGVYDGKWIIDEEEAIESKKMSWLQVIPMWHYHLQQMVIADDPIKYLGENI